jgi:CubicO group peptidase (beta-lactamase class C family)
MLLTHTSGYTYSWYNIHIKRWTDQNVDDIVSVLIHLAATELTLWQFRGDHLKMPLVNEPGSKFEYGISMDWAGILVERIAHSSLNDYCQGWDFPPHATAVR